MWKYQFSRVTRRWYRFQKHDRVEQRGTARDGWLHRDPGHVRFRGSEAEPVGASVHQPLRGDDATLLQHAHIQEFDRELPGRGHPVRRGGRLRRQRALYRSHLVPGKRFRSIDFDSKSNDRHRFLSVSQRTGLLSMLDVECSIRGTAESYVAKVKVQHKQNPRLFEPRTVDCRSFGIQHFAGRVTYDASDFLGKKNTLPTLFHR